MKSWLTHSIILLYPHSFACVTFIRIEVLKELFVGIISKPSRLTARFLEWVERYNRIQVNEENKTICISFG